MNKITNTEIVHTNDDTNDNIMGFNIFTTREKLLRTVTPVKIVREIYFK